MEKLIRVSFDPSIGNGKVGLIEYFEPGTLAYMKMCDGSVRRVKFVDVTWDKPIKDLGNDLIHPIYTLDIAGIGIVKNCFISLSRVRSMNNELSYRSMVMQGSLYDNLEKAIQGSCDRCGDSDRIGETIRVKKVDAFKLFKDLFKTDDCLIKIGSNITLNGVWVKKDNSLGTIPANYSITINENYIFGGTPDFDSKSLFPTFKDARNSVDVKVYDFASSVAPKSVNDPNVTIMVTLPLSKIDSIKKLGVTIVKETL